MSLIYFLIIDPVITQVAATELSKITILCLMHVYLMINDLRVDYMGVNSYMFYYISFSYLG